jgi:hypothetical protein
VQFWLEKVSVLPSRELSSGASPNRLSAKSLSLNTYTVRRRVVRGIARANSDGCSRWSARSDSGNNIFRVLSPIFV